MTAQKAELYDLAGNKLPQTWVKYLPTGGGVIGKSRQECEANYQVAIANANHSYSGR